MRYAYGCGAKPTWERKVEIMKTGEAGMANPRTNSYNSNTLVFAGVAVGLDAG